METLQCVVAWLCESVSTLAVA